jgi:hypothetical protein
MMTVALRPDGTLTLSSRADRAPAAELVYDRDLQFRIKQDPSIVIEFQRNARGEIFALTSHQANGNVPAVRQDTKQVDRVQLRTLAGSYQAGAATFNVELDSGGALTFAVAGNTAVELLHARELLFVIRGSAGAYIEFVRDPGGAITGLVVHGATPVVASRMH